MKLIRHAIAFIAIVAATQILAESPKDSAVSTTEDFIAFCDVSEDDPAYEAAMGFCLGYIDAVMDSLVCLLKTEADQKSVTSDVTSRLAGQAA